MKNILRSLIIGFVAFIFLSKAAVAYGNYELERYKLPGFWHTLRGHPLVLISGKDISNGPLKDKLSEIWLTITRLNP